MPPSSDQLSTRQEHSVTKEQDSNADHVITNDEETTVQSLDQIKILDSTLRRKNDGGDVTRLFYLQLYSSGKDKGYWACRVGV